MCRKEIFLVFAFWATGFCSRNEPVNKPEPTGVAQRPSVREEKTDEMKIVGITGSISRQQVNAVMNEAGVMKLQMCLDWIYQQRSFISGSVKFLFKINPDGKVDEVKITASSLGDYLLEKCMVKKFSYIKFPKPQGGGAETTYSFDIDLPSGIREPEKISQGEVKEALAEYEEDMKQCIGGRLGGLKMTIYIGNGWTEEVRLKGKSGRRKAVDFSKVLSIGGVCPDGSIECMECIFERAKHWKVKLDSRGYILKSSLNY